MGEVMEEQKWLLTKPEGVVSVAKLHLNPHPEGLEGKTIFLRWNGKHNGNILLEKIEQLLVQQIKDVNIIRSWEVLPETAVSSRNNHKSEGFAEKIAKYKPDLVIGAQAD